MNGRHCSSLLGLSWLILQASVSFAADWPAYLNGNDRVGFSSAALSPDLHLSWIYRTPARPEIAFSGPRSTPIEGHVMLHRVNFDAAMNVVHANGRSYFGSTVDHRVYCVDSNTGKTVWSFYTDGPIRLAPTLAHGNAYFGSDDGKVYCLNAETGDVVWQMRVGPKDDRLLSRGEMIARWPVRTGVLIDGETAYFGAGIFPHETIYLCAVKAKTGEIVWKNDRISQQDAGRNELSPQGYLLCNEDYLYVPSGRSLPVAVSKATGEIVFQRKHSWRADAGGVVGGTKALLGDGQVYSGGPHHFLAMEEKSGDVGAAFIGGRQMVLAEEYAYLLDGTKIFCVNRAEHAQASQEKQKWFLKSAKVRKDPELLQEAEQKIKEYAGVGIVWEFPSEHDDALIATDKLVIAGGKNQVTVLDRATGEKLFEAPVEGNVMGLSATDSLLTVSTDSGHIYGFGTKAVDAVQEWPEPFSAAFATDELTDHFQRTAAEVIERSGQRTGFCLVVGSEDGRLAYEIAKQSSLTVFAIEPDEKKASASRAALERTGLHASRVTIVNCTLNEIPFANYFANLIVSETQLRTGQMPCEPDKIARFLKPCGGVAMMARPGHFPGSAGADETAISNWVTGFYQQNNGELQTDERWHMVRRGKLPGAGEWTHQYGNPANTSFTNDQRVRDGLGVLWYGDPGPSAMINRHEAAGAPLSTYGRMFIQGVDSVMAYDAYNGSFLWEHENPGAIRTGVFNNRETHNLAASEDVLYMAVGESCKGLDAATGNVISEFKVPASDDGVARAWAYVAYDNGQLFGTSTIRQELEEKLRRRGITVKSQTDAIFGVDTRTGQFLWTYRGTNILHTTIAIGPEAVYFIDSSLTPEQRQDLYRRDKPELQNLTGDEALKAEEEMKKLDVRLAVAIDRTTGKKLWEKTVNVTDTTDVSAGGGNLTVMYADGHLLLCGANANGHYWKQFMAGEFKTRKLLVLDAKSGEEKWSKNANYMNRPAVVEGQIYAEPWAFELQTGKEKTRIHPLTGEETPWQYSRPGHHCGVITATPNMMFFRSGFIGYYDLYEDSGTRHFAGQRLGCWVNAIPGNGLVMIPEASAGCVCQFSIASTVVLEPKTENKSWGILSAVGDTTPVKRIGINFGAPGDRKDKAQKAWFGFPRPMSVNRLEFVFDIQPQLAEGGGWYSHNPDAVQVESDDASWLFASGARGLEHFEIPLLGAEDKPTSYDVRMFFTDISPMELDGVKVSFQGQELSGETQTNGSNSSQKQAVVEKVYSTVRVEKNLVVDVKWPADKPQPTIAAMEVIHHDH